MSLLARRICKIILIGKKSRQVDCHGDDVGKEENFMEILNFFDWTSLASTWACGYFLIQVVYGPSVFFSAHLLESAHRRFSSVKGKQ